MLSENMASLGGEQIISSKDTQDTTPQKPASNSRPSSVERKTSTRDRDEKIRLIKERQNEERQRKIEELKAQAEAAQKYREQKEEERKRRIDELRRRDNDRQQQVEERRKAIMEAEKERREILLRRNQDRDAKLENKRKNEKSSNVYAFGSSTPRLLDPAELGTLSQSTYWGHRRSTSITNVAYTGAPLSRRSSERELSDGAKKRATSAGGIDRHDDRRFKSTSMYEVFNWGHNNDEPPKRFSLSFAATEINIDGPTKQTRNHTSNAKAEETTDSPPISYRSVFRRKTDLMPTIPSPRESSFGSKTSLYSHTPRTPGRAVSMTRLDQLAQPIRRNGEHIRAVIERERQQQYDLLSDSNTLTQIVPTGAATQKSMSRSMTHLAGAKQVFNKHNNNYNNDNNMIGNLSVRSLHKSDTSRSMTQLTPANRIITNNNTTTTITKKIIAARSARYERKDDAPSSLNSTGSRSGDVTPGGSINTSRPGSAMSTSTTASVHRRTVGTARKPRPASIAVTGVSLNDEINKHKKEKPPLPKQSSTPKRVISNSNLMSKSMTVENGKLAEKRTPIKKDVPTPKPRSTAVQQPADNNVAEKAITETKGTVKTEDKKTENKTATTDVPQTKEEKEALNAVKTESTTVVTETVEVAKQVARETEQQSKEQQSIEVTPTEEKLDNDTEKEKEPSPKPVTGVSELRELSAERQDNNNDMTASMIARSKITTEEEAKAALAEKRRRAREEAERQAELERQRLEAERLAELQRQAEEEERQRKFEEETLRLAEEQKQAEEERLLQAIEEAKKREEVERLKREDEERQRIERDEAERKAKEEAEKQRLEIAERLKKEEKEREERRKRVEAIMSRTRAKGGNATPNSTPTKDNDGKTNGKDEKEQEISEISVSEQNIEIDENSKLNDSIPPQQQQPITEQSQPAEQAQQLSQQTTDQHSNPSQQSAQQQESFSEQCAYEKTVTDKENALIKSFSNMIIDENAKTYPNFQNPFVQMTNGGKTLQEQNQSNEPMIVQSMANGNGHIENINKNDTNQLVDLATTKTEQLIDFNNESQEITGSVNFNNNSLSATMTTTGSNLVTSDSHENKEISLL